MVAVSGSMARAKSNGERGHPCLVPLCKSKEGDKVLSILMQALGALYNNLIQEVIFSPRLSFSSIPIRFVTLKRLLL